MSGPWFKPVTVAEALARKVGGRKVLGWFLVVRGGHGLCHLLLSRKQAEEVARIAARTGLGATWTPGEDGEGWTVTFDTLESSAHAVVAG